MSETSLMRSKGPRWSSYDIAWEYFGIIVLKTRRHTSFHSCVDVELEGVPTFNFSSPFDAIIGGRCLLSQLAGTSLPSSSCSTSTVGIQDFLHFSKHWHWKTFVIKRLSSLSAPLQVSVERSYPPTLCIFNLLWILKSSAYISWMEVFLVDVFVFIWGPTNQN